MASVFRDPVRLTFVDPDNLELGRVDRPEFVPRVGENVRLSGRPYVIERVGYDYPAGTSGTASPMPSSRRSAAT